MLSSTSIGVSSSSVTRFPAGACRFFVWHATQLRSRMRLDVAEVFDVLDSLLEAHARLVLDVPLLAGLIVSLRGQAAACSSSGRTGVVRPGGGGLLERRRLLTVGVTAAAVVAHLAGPKLMPGLRHVEDHAVACRASGRSRRRRPEF